MGFEPNVFDPVLSSNEAVAWTGRPHFVPYLLTGVPFLVIGCLWGAFDLQFIRHMPASQMGFAIPFLALHLFPFWGSILYMLYLVISFHNVVYALTAPLLSWMVRAVPTQMTTSEQLGRAMIKVARDGYPKPILESADINAI